MIIFDEIAKVPRLADAEASGDVNAHGPLLAAIRQLQLTAEKPVETTSRVNFQVRIHSPELREFPVTT